MPPPSSGGTILVQMLNVLEGYDLKSAGFGSAQNVHLIAETMRRAFADRAQHLGDPDFNANMPIARLISKDYARDRSTNDQSGASLDVLAKQLFVAGGKRRDDARFGRR